MKVYLDNQRAAPAGWLAVRWPEDAILLLATNEVTELSLDHDFGRGGRGSSDEVLQWIAEAVATRGFAAPAITIHSINSNQKQRLQARVAEITRLVPATTKKPRTKIMAKYLEIAESALPDIIPHNKRGSEGRPPFGSAPTGIIMAVPDADSVGTAYRAAADDLFKRYASDQSAARVAEHRDHVAWNEKMFRQYWFYRLGTNFGSEPASRMNDGFDHGPGWRMLLERLSDKLLALLGPAETAAVYLEVLQVKEKSGGLRFYYRLYNRDADAAACDDLSLAIRAAVDDACAVSTGICEQCGLPGNVRQGKRIATLCSRCAG